MVRAVGYSVWLVRGAPRAGRRGEKARLGWWCQDLARSLTRRENPGAGARDAAAPAQNLVKPGRCDGGGCTRPPAACEALAACARHRVLRAARHCTAHVTMRSNPNEPGGSSPSRTERTYELWCSVWKGNPTRLARACGTTALDGKRGSGAAAAAAAATAVSRLGAAPPRRQRWRQLRPTPRAAGCSVLSWAEAIAAAAGVDVRLVAGGVLSAVRVRGTAGAPSLSRVVPLGGRRKTRAARGRAA
jgi:hypothetical protein